MWMGFRRTVQERTVRNRLLAHWIHPGEQRQLSSAPDISMTALAHTLAAAQDHIREWRQGRFRMLVTAQPTLTCFEYFGGERGAVAGRHMRAAGKAEHRCSSSQPA